MALSTLTVSQSSSITNANKSVTYSWVNIKDLAPLEIIYKFSITVKCNTKFSNGNYVPFGYNFTGILLTCKFNNNGVSASVVNIAILLDDGIRYIGSPTFSGTDASKFSAPIISTVLIDGKLFTQLYFGNINLSINSSTTVVFSYAIWNQYNNNHYYPQLGPSVSGFITFTVIPQSTLITGSTITTQGIAVSYYNDVKITDIPAETLY